MQQFFADFPSTMQNLISAAFPDLQAVILKILLLAIFIVFEVWVCKKENKCINKNTKKVWLGITLVCIILFFITNTAWEFIKWLIICAALDIINLTHTIWRKKHPDSDIW